LGDSLSKDWVALQLDAFTNNTAFRRAHQLNLRVVGVARTHHHTFGHQVSELTGFEIDEHETEPLGHLVERHKLLQTGPDRPNFVNFADVDLLYVQLLGLRMRRALEYFADTQIAVAEDVPNFFDGRLFRLCCRLVGLLLLFGLFLFGLLLSLGLFRLRIGSLGLIGFGLGLGLLLLFGGFGLFGFRLFLWGSFFFHFFLLFRFGLNGLRFRYVLF